MNVYRSFSLLVVLLLSLPSSSFPQGSAGFDIDAYSQFLASYQDMSAGGLGWLHPAGTFRRESETPYFYRLIAVGQRLTGKMAVAK